MQLFVTEQGLLALQRLFPITRNQWRVVPGLAAKQISKNWLR